MAFDDGRWSGLRVIYSRSAVQPLPVVPPALQDALLSSWICRHAAFYGVGVTQMLGHCRVNTRFPRHLGLALAAVDQGRLGEIFRCGPEVIGKMTQSRNGRPAQGPIATVRPMQVCGHCARRHQAAESTRGARLRSWMEGWRISCPACGARLEDVRFMDLLTKVDAAESLLVRTTDHARRGELLIDNGLRGLGGTGAPLIELMRPDYWAERLPGAAGRGAQRLPGTRGGLCASPLGR